MQVAYCIKKGVNKQMSKITDHMQFLGSSLWAIINQDKNLTQRNYATDGAVQSILSYTIDFHVMQQIIHVSGISYKINHASHA